MMTALIISIIVLALVIIIILMVGNILANIILKPKTTSTKDMLEMMKKGKVYDDALVDSFAFTDFELESRYGYKLSGCIINRKPGTDSGQSIGKDINKNIAVVCHGYTACRPCSYAYTDVFLKLGFTVVMYDHRNHGESEKAYTSMGYYEKYDLQSVIDWCYEKFGKDINIVTHGESMGAAIVLDLLNIDTRPKCVIADCGYNRLINQVDYLMKNLYHLPKSLFVPVARWIIRRRAGFDIMNVNPINGVVSSETPIQFIHGGKDEFVPTFMSIEMHNARKQNTSLYICEGAKHAESYRSNPTEYERVVKEFLDKYYFC